MKYWVRMNHTNYTVTSVELMDETLKDGEAKQDGSLFAQAISLGKNPFLRGGVNTITASGDFAIEVEANSEEEAKRIAPIECLKKRVKDLEEMRKRAYDDNKNQKERDSAIIKKMHDAQKAFMKIIRAGELSTVDTGKRILITWYDQGGTRNAEICSGVQFTALVEGIQNANSSQDEDCY